MLESERQPQRRHRANQPAIQWSHRNRVPALAEHLLGPDGQFVVVAHDVFPAELIKKFESGVNRQKAADVARSLPAEFLLEAVLVVMADDQRMDFTLSRAIDPQECAAFGRADPFMQISRVKRRL